ncbi:MAG: hypothetical protein FRX49_06513 [Trebouxia sp. A1-2]|nr:MAG: hypothetical protein FRX49_06513 [Trebouxia sp. A1-2]
MRAYLSLNGGADGSMQLRQLVLQLQLVGLCMARAAVEEPGRPVPGLLPAPRGVQPAGLQHTAPGGTAELAGQTATPPAMQKNIWAAESCKNVSQVGFDVFLACDKLGLLSSVVHQLCRTMGVRDSGDACGLWDIVCW